MTFPDGRIKDGHFEKNIFKGAVKIQAGSLVDKSLNFSGDEYSDKKYHHRESIFKQAVIANGASSEHGAMASGDPRGRDSQRAPREMLIKTRGSGSAERKKQI